MDWGTKASHLKLINEIVERWGRSRAPVVKLSRDKKERKMGGGRDGIRRKDIGKE